jgi:Mce-associated membrane protein
LSDTSTKDSRFPQLFLTGAVALVVAAAAVAGWFGVSWFSAANDDSLAFSQVRDEVNRVGQAAVVTMNTLDYKTVDQGLKDWENATTGDLHDEIVKGKASSRDAIVQAQSVTKATVLSSAVSELDDRAGQASIMVALKVNVTVKGQQPTDKFMRLAGKLQRTEDGWKLYEIGQVPYLQPGQQ